VYGEGKAQSTVTTGTALTHGDQHIGRLTAALGDLTRRRVFFALRAAGEPQTKDDIAAAVGIDRRLAGFHLDKLVEYGFAAVPPAAPRGTAAGPGRPPKRYRVAREGVLTAQPERHYELLASLLLKATREGGASRQDALERVGYEFGLEAGLTEVAAGRESPSAESLAEALEAVARLLNSMGFAAAAARGEDAGVSLRACACPFEELAFDEPGRICGLDRAIWSGMIAAFAPEARVTVAGTRPAGDEECLVMVEQESVPG
jgi:predicted ArsR family transcriptional regulator